jgi:hypothetical protein
MHKNTMKCNKTQSKWCINKHGASKIIDTFEMYQGRARPRQHTPKLAVISYTLSASSSSLGSSASSQSSMTEPPYRQMMTYKYRGSQQSLREVKPKFIDLTQGEPNNIYKP